MFFLQTIDFIFKALVYILNFLFIKRVISTIKYTI